MPLTLHHREPSTATLPAQGIAPIDVSKTGLVLINNSLGAAAQCGGLLHVVVQLLRLLRLEEGMRSVCGACHGMECMECMRGASVACRSKRNDLSVAVIV